MTTVKKETPQAKAAAQATASQEALPEEGSHRFDTLRREIDRLFDEFGPGNWRLPFRRGSGLEVPGPRRELFPHSPAIDMVEQAHAYVLSAELPGMGEEDVEIKLSNHHLSIRGEKTEEREESDQGYYLSERRYGAFHRTFRLPDGVDAGRIEAGMKNGLLTVTIPKSKEAKAQEKTITVKPA